MFPKKIILWQFLSLIVIRSSRNLFRTIQIFLIASLILNSFDQEKIVALAKNTTFTSASNNNTVQEPPTFLLLGNDVELKNLTRVYFDAHVAGYVSKEILLNINFQWPFKSASKIWAYVKKIYGPYGFDPHIYVVFYNNATSQGSIDLKNFFSTHIDANNGFKNIVKIWKQGENAWPKELNETTELVYFAFFVGNIVESASKNTKGSPSYNHFNKIARLIGWNFVFAFDVISKTLNEHEAESFLDTDSSFSLKNNDQNIKESSNLDDTINWIKTWFGPIYSKHGGAQALSQFHTNCFFYFPRKLLYRNKTEADSYYEYNKTMNKGEFVHFWSGSVGIDLRYLANFAFTWDEYDEKNFQNARNSYPMLKYQCNKTSCEKLLVLDQFFTGVDSTVPSNLKRDEHRPAITVISEKERYGSEEPIRTRVHGNLYRPLNQSERYLYDGNNDLFIFETPSGSCYYITCSAPYIIKWVTNIPLDEERGAYSDCQTGNYLNSRRMQDITYKNEDSKGQAKKKLIQKYTIQFTTEGVINKYNMGLLKCESIQNSTLATHIYLTDNNIDPGKYQFPPNRSIAEIFVDHNSDRKLILPCIGTSMKMMPNLRIRTKGNLDDEWNTIWDKKNKTVDAETVGYSVTHDPVIGFAIAYEIWPFDGVSYTKKKLYFECFFKTQSRIGYKVYMTYKEKQLTSNLTIVDDEYQIPLKASGCFLVKNFNRFLFIGNETGYGEYSLKFITCSTPHSCDFFRQCLDYADNYCYSDHRELQADYVQ